MRPSKKSGFRADTITVLRQGRTVATAKPADVTTADLAELNPPLPEATTTWFQPVDGSPAIGVLSVPGGAAAWRLDAAEWIATPDASDTRNCNW